MSINETQEEIHLRTSEMSINETRENIEIEMQVILNRFQMLMMYHNVNVSQCDTITCNKRYNLKCMKHGRKLEIEMNETQNRNWK